jgi:hypothetical protein
VHDCGGVISIAYLSGAMLYSRLAINSSGHYNKKNAYIGIESAFNIA